MLLEFKCCVCVCVCPEHEMEEKLQDHRQEIQKLTQNWELEKEKLVYQTALKLEAEEVSRTSQFSMSGLHSLCQVLYIKRSKKNSN